MFRNLTKQMAGEEMTAQDNVKRLYVKDVAMLDGQFHDYSELHIIGIESAGDYLIPDGCFSEISHLETLDCHVQGTLTLGKDIVNKGITFTVKVYTQQSAEAWKAYKESTGAAFTIDDSGVPTGIQAPSTLNGQRSMIYDLLGRRAVQPARGIYVEGGRKLMR